MKAAYVDTSWLVAIAFDEPNADDLARRLRRFDAIFSSNLLEAEFRATLVREEVADEPVMLDSLSWVVPDRPLGRETRLALAHGYVRGGDLWHLACALFLAPDARNLAFLTLDVRQKSVAKALGFRVE